MELDIERDNILERLDRFKKTREFQILAQCIDWALEDESEQTIPWEGDNDLFLNILKERCLSLTELYTARNFIEGLNTQIPEAGRESSDH